MQETEEPDADITDLDEAALLLGAEDDVGDIEQPEKPGEGAPEKETASKLSALREVVKIAKRFVSALFSTTSPYENFILALGCLFATVHGMVFPFVAIIFGSMTNLFIQQSAKGFPNATDSIPAEQNATEYSAAGTSALEKLSGAATGVSVVDKIFGGVMDLINRVVLQTFTEQQALTREEFIATVTTTGKLFCFLSILVFITSFLQVLCWEWVAVNQKYELRKNILRRILEQRLQWFAAHDVAELISNVFNEVARVREAIGYQFSAIVQCLAMFLASSVLGFFISWRLALVFLSPVPVLLLRALTLGEKIGNASQEARELWQAAESVQEETLQKVDTVIAFGQQQEAIVRFGTKLELAVDALFKKFHMTAIGRAILFLSIYGSYAGAFWYGCRLLEQHAISAGEIYAIFLAATMGTVALMGMLSLVTVVGNAYGAAVHLHEFGDDDDNDEEEEATHLKIQSEIRGEIEFEGVTFSYPTAAPESEAPPLLRDLSFKIPCGKTVAIFGDVGTGKSTIAALLLRLLRPTAGAIRVDGTDIRGWDTEKLRSQIVLATQKPQLMPGESVDENILAGRELQGFDLKWLEARLKAAKELVDSSGELQSANDVSRLSASAKAKINIARALLTDPPILVLDSVFMDPVLEPIQEKVMSSRRESEKTTILLTNDVFQCGDVDLIYVLHEGQIAPEDVGSFNELYAHGEGSRFHDVFEEAKNAGRFRLAEMTLEDAPEETAEPGDKIVDLGLKDVADQGQEPSLLQVYDVGSTTRKLFGLGLLGCALGGAQLALFAFYFVEMFSTFSKTGSALSSDAVFWCGMLVLLAVIAAAGIWLRVLFMSAAAMYLVLRVRTTAFASILRRPKSYYDPLMPKTTPENLGTRVLFAVPSIRHVLEFGLPEELSTCTALAIVSAIIATLVWEIGLILITGVFVVFSLLAWALFKIQRWAQDSFQDVDAAAASVILKAVSVIQLVHIYAMEEWYFGKYSEATAPSIGKAHRQAAIFSVLYALCETIIFAFFGVSFLYGAQLIQERSTEPESLFKVFFAMALCIVSFNQSVSLMPALARAACDLEWITNLVREEDKFDSSLDALNEEGDEPEEHTWQDGAIHFENVHFEYQTPEGPVPVLCGLNLSIPPGASVAITGTTSADGGSNESAPFGGTTILYLIMRFYDVTKGELQIDYRNIKELNIGAFRKRIGWVPQRPEFVGGSLAENLVYGNDNGAKVDTDALQAVLEKVQLADQVQHLHEPRTDEYWRGLPCGTRVLLALARALLRRPWILLLDSPTSGMSHEEKVKVEDVLRVLCSSNEQTLVLVTSVTSTFPLCNRIETISGGRCQAVQSFMAVC